MFKCMCTQEGEKNDKYRVGYRTQIMHIQVRKLHGYGICHKSAISKDFNAQPFTDCHGILSNLELFQNIRISGN